MLEPEVETRPWDEQLALDDAAYRAQLAYLLERSPFYREKLAAAGSTRRPTPAASPTSPRLPLTEKHELRATVTPENPIGAHLCARRDEIVRIYSTSGTTGTPSYIPLTARRPRQLGHRLGAQLRRLRRRGRAADRLDLQRRAVRRRRGARRVRPHRPLPHPGRHRQHRAAGARRSSCCGPRRRCSRPRTPRYLLEWAAERGVDLAGSSVERVLVAGEPGGGEPAFRAKLEEGWGARVTEAMGIGDIGVSLWGECEEQDGMHLGARGFVHAELIDPETGDAVRAGRRRAAASSCSPTSATAPRRCCASARATTSWSGPAPCPCGRTGPRVRCVGRTDDMLIVRGVNVFPSAVREVVERVRAARERPHPRPARERRA